MTVQTTKTTAEMWDDWHYLTSGFSGTFKIPEQKITAAFYKLIGAETFELRTDSKAQQRVFSMCYTMLDAAGLWRGIYEDSSVPGKIIYYAMDEHGNAIVELVREKLNTIARCFRTDDVEAICDDMIATWEKGVPALDVLA